MSASTYVTHLPNPYPWPAAAIELSGHFAFINAAFTHGFHAEAVERASRAQPHLLEGVRAVPSLVQLLTIPR